jgi:hypothetical protein
VTLDPELEEALASASDTELYDLAGQFSGLAHDPYETPRHVLSDLVQTYELLVAIEYCVPRVTAALSTYQTGAYG